MLTIPAAVKLWYCPDAVDMRLGFDGLFALVQNRLKADPLSGHLFIFRNRTADRLKILYWGGHGLCLWCQRLEAGRYHFPDAPSGASAVELMPASCRWSWTASTCLRVRRFKRFSPIPA